MKILFILLLASAILFPEINSYLRFDDLIIVIISIIVVLELQKFHKFTFPSKIVNYIFIILLLYFLSMTNFMLFNNTDIINIPNAFKEIARLLKIFILFIILENNKSYKNYNLLNILKLFTIITVIVAVLQYIDIFNIKNLIETYYKPESIQYYNLKESLKEMGAFRITSTFYNPNIYATFLLIPFCIVLTSIFESFSKKDIIYAAIIIFGIMLSQSRTGFIIMIILIIKNLFEYYKNKKENYRNIIKILVIIILTSLLLYFLLNYFRLLRLSRIDLGLLSYYRISSYTLLFKAFSNSPLWGKSILCYKNFPFDSEYFVVFFNCGTGGIVVYFYVLYQVFKSNRNYSYFKRMMLSNLLIIVPLTGITNGFIFSNRIFPIFLLIYYIVKSDNIKLIKKGL
jgi:hypothetical protein